MNHRILFVIAAATAACAAMGQQINVTTTGTATFNGTLGVPGQVTISNQGSTLNAAPVSTGSEFGGNRAVLQFSSAGTGVVDMPTDQFGNTAATTPGSAPVVFPTWDANRYGGALQSFNADIPVDLLSDTSVTMDAQPAPFEQGSQAGGVFTHDLLPAVVNPTDVFNLNCNLPTYSFSRPVVNFADGSTVVSPFGELASTGVWIVLGTVSNQFQYIFQSPFGTSDPTSQMINADDPTNGQIVGPWSGVDTVDFGAQGVLPGTYSVTYYAITWDTFGLPDNTLSNDTAGNFQQFDVGSVQVVPEPAPSAMLGLGAVGLLLRRRNR